MHRQTHMHWVSDRSENIPIVTIQVPLYFGIPNSFKQEFAIPIYIIWLANGVSNLASLVLEAMRALGMSSPLVHTRPTWK